MLLSSWVRFVSKHRVIEIDGNVNGNHLQEVHNRMKKVLDEFIDDGFRVDFKSIY